MNNDALAHNVRGWVHYDNMAAALNKQIVNTRKQRDAFEEQIQILLKHKLITEFLNHIKQQRPVNSSVRLKKLKAPTAQAAGTPPNL